jgi:diguanylate cyclase (GGDEF)-like protein
MNDEIILREDGREMKKPVRENSTDVSANEKLLKDMNKDLRDFLKHSMHSESFWEKWQSMGVPAQHIRCWEFMNCTLADCPSYGERDFRCWLKSGTLCGGEVVGDFAKKYKSCFKCPVFKQVEKDPVQSLYENINILIHHLKERDDKMVTAAIKDPLTGAYNRTYFNEFTEKTIQRAGRNKEFISFIMADLDGFKGLNDQYGHQAGDDVLVETATLLGGTMRGADLLFRYGGDEFLIVLPHANCSEAASIQDRIEQSVDEWNRANTRYNEFKLSLSIGCSTWKQGDDILSTIKEADSMMYEEKRRSKVIDQNMRQDINLS